MAIHIHQPYKLYLQCQDSTKSSIALNTATAKKVYFIDPDGIGGTWDATISDTTKLYVFVSGAMNNKSGLWFFHSYPTYGTEDGNPVPGNRAELKVLALGESS